MAASRRAGIPRGAVPGWAGGDGGSAGWGCEASAAGAGRRREEACEAAQQDRAEEASGFQSQETWY